MRAIHFVVFAVIAAQLTEAASEGEPIFEVPVQLIGFPVIILAVKLSNFVKKLAYAVNPSTYQARSKRAIYPDDKDVERRLVAELGDSVCVYEKVCARYAERSIADSNNVLDWGNIFRKYEETTGDDNRKFYLLSVFLGDIVASPELCHRLAKRGRGCRA